MKFLHKYNIARKFTVGRFVISTTVQMWRYKQDAEREENLREFTWRK